MEVHKTAWEFRTKRGKQKVSPTSAYKEHTSRSLAHTRCTARTHEPGAREGSTWQKTQSDAKRTM